MRDGYGGSGYHGSDNCGSGNHDATSSKLATSGPVAVAGGQRRTVVLLDSAGVLRFRVIQE